MSVLPIAQASVLRWVLMGGISANQVFGMACWWWCPGVSTAAPFRTFVWGGVGKAVRGVRCRVVFGALLGPEATGPFCSNAGNPGVSCCSCGRHPPRVCVGWVWLTGLLFENYIVDASIWTHGPALFLGVWVVCSSNFFDE